MEKSMFVNRVNGKSQYNELQCSNEHIALKDCLEHQTVTHNKAASNIGMNRTSKLAWNQTFA